MIQPIAVRPSGTLAAEAASNALDEISRVFAELDWHQVGAAVGELIKAERVYCTGNGRSGLSARAFAMRLMHLGLTAHMVGETATPGIGDHDLLVVISAKGGSSTIAQASIAKAQGAKVLAVTTAAGGGLGQESDLVLVVPARTTVATTQHAGSLFEQACLILGDAMCSAIQQVLDVPESELDRRHANLP